MSRTVQKSQRLDDARVEFLLARYSALNEELQNRNSYNYQMISLHLTIVAAILTFGLQPDSSASVLFIVPITSMLLGLVVTHNFLARRRLGMLIKNEIEAEFNFVSNDPTYQTSYIRGILGYVGTGGLFMIVQIFTLGLGLLKIQQYTTLDIVLIISDILAVVIVIWSIGTIAKATMNTESPAQRAG